MHKKEPHPKPDSELLPNRAKYVPDIYWLALFGGSSGSSCGSFTCYLNHTVSISGWSYGAMIPFGTIYKMIAVAGERTPVRTIIRRTTEIGDNNICGTESNIAVYIKYMEE